jgi:hypothetical protein
MSQLRLTSSEFQSKKHQHNNRKKHLFSAADVECGNRPQHTVTEQKLDAIKLRAKRFVSEGACSDLSSTVDGLLGETAVSELIPNAEKPDTEVRPHGDGGWDMKIGEVKVDIKTAKQQTKVPSLGVSEALNADCYLLANRIDRRTCRLVGFEYRDNISNRTKSRVNHYDYVLDQEDLYPITSDVLLSMR